MPIIYFDCPMGIAGDMCLGALLDAGLPLDYLRSQLAKLSISGEYELTTETVRRQGQRATKLWVHLSPADPPASEPPERQRHGHDHPHHHGPHNHNHSTKSDRGPSRHLADIKALIEQAGLSPRVTDWSLAVFDQLAQAEAAVHGTSPAQVHFHEVGAVDAIVDIVGTCIALDWFDIEEIHCSSMPTGGGSVRAAHGRLPVPVPAVLQLWQQRQVPVYHNGIDRELVTPTGAALTTTLARRFGPPPAMALQRVGLGAGTAELAQPNVLRVWIGALTPGNASEGEQAAAPFGDRETVTVLETQVDDLSPQVIGYLYERLLGIGALDVFTQSIGMKKSRPGILISVICHPPQAEGCERVLFEETSTLGVRRRQQQRTVLHRTMVTAQTSHGPIRLKIARPGANQPVVNVQPEYEDCAAIARKAKLPLRTVYEQALAAWREMQSTE
ncbi:MAG: nickel pincer cofactor biosynthesis protein LarC [Cyanobacteria bacterium P01_A01_bin.135]